MILLLLALQSAPAPVTTLPPAFVERSAVLAKASVVSGFCLSLGWQSGSAGFADRDLDRLAGEYGVSPGDARILVLRQFADEGEALKARFPVDASRPPDQQSRLAFLDQVDAFARTACADVARQFPGMFAGDIASNQALVDARIAAVRTQELARP